MHDAACDAGWAKADASRISVMETMRGRASITFGPGRSRTIMGGKPGPKGGIAVRIGYFYNCVERKNLYAEAYAKILRSSLVSKLRHLLT
jgi:hypothetical protein